MTTRRSFLGRTLLAGGAIGLGGATERQAQLLGGSLKPEKEKEVLAAWHTARG